MWPIPAWHPGRGGRAHALHAGMGAEAWAAGAQVKLCVVVGAAGLVINTLLLRSLLAWLGKVRLLWLGAARGAHRVLQSHDACMFSRAHAVLPDACMWPQAPGSAACTRVAGRGWTAMARTAQQAAASLTRHRRLWSGLAHPLAHTDSGACVLPARGAVRLVCG